MKRWFGFILIAFSIACYSQEAPDTVAKSAVKEHAITFNGQITSWGIVQLEGNVPFQLGGRFVPTLLGNFSLPNQSKLDFEASLNVNGTMNFVNFKLDDYHGEIKPYRVWLRYSTDTWEVRGGLQKINFGSAKMFRPLMWFDGMDIRDPLQLTNGVYGILGKYFFPNNTNIWLWGLIGNKKPKGYESFGSEQWKPELGGHIELPLGPGEMGFSYNHRTLNLNNNPFGIEVGNITLPENRLGINGKWDVGVGLWFESSINITDTKNTSFPLLYKYTDMWNIGADYTFSFGNGLGATLEYFRYHAGDKLVVKGSAVNVIGTMLTYPLSLLDNLTGMIFYIPNGSQWMNYLSWGRTYDNLSLYLMAYWNPGNVNLILAQAQQKNLFAGKGIQLMVNYNF